jgi:hypothetical protein
MTHVLDKQLDHEAPVRGLSVNAQKLKTRVLIDLENALELLAIEFNQHRTPSQAIVEIERAPSAVIVRDSSNIGMIVAAYVDTELRISSVCRLGPSDFARLIPEWSSMGVSYSYHDNHDNDLTDKVAQDIFDILTKSEAFTEEDV